MRMNSPIQALARQGLYLHARANASILAHASHPSSYLVFGMISHAEGVVVEVRGSLADSSEDDNEGKVKIF